MREGLSYLWPERHFRDVIRDLTPPGAVVCDIGGGRSPQFDRGALSEETYVLLDVDADELANAPKGYDTLHCDIGELDVSDRFDVMFSKMVAEHVSDGEAFHANVLRALKPGGVAVHYYPTRTAPVFLLNRLLPERLGDLILERAAKREHRKFPARYSWCLGPGRTMRRRLERLGFAVQEHRGFHGYYYFNRVPLLRWFDRAYWAAAARLGRGRRFTSYSLLTVRKR